MIEKLQTNWVEHGWIADKINEIIDAVNEMSEDNFSYERGYSDGYVEAKVDVSEGKQDEQDIICPTCHYSDMEMIGDPEYNDEWHCENCGHDGGSSFGKPEGSNLDETPEDNQEDEEKYYTIKKRAVDYYIAEHLNEKHSDYPKFVEGIKGFFKWVEFPDED